MAPKEVDRQLLLDYLEGNCSRNQLLQIREFLHDEAYRDSLDKFMQEEWETLDGRQFPPLPGMEGRYRKFRAAYSTPKHRTPPRIIRRMTATAAVILLAAISLRLLLPRLSGPQDRSAATQWLSWHNDPGHRREIALPDSTRVYLGPAGTLRYDRKDGHDRLVQLEGEAYFVVRHDQRRPFTVVTGALSTRDIGTEFNVRYYPGEATIAIAVASGKVQVLNATTPATSLAPGQILQYDTLTRNSAITDLDPSSIGAWRNGILTFHRQPLKEVTEELERYYGVRFRYSNPSEENILITTQLANKNLTDALDILALTAGVHFTPGPNRILIK
ncbi:MAG TPA: FecR domain-containing protein [Puia sp.]|uniref:FecR family protein n=1 Tax=Puia sp. TaxID=2045100 RepID=UPI002BDC1D09|nr:FecR domain-containing protein [Puia sp.]HVU99679.1 FecR domain-containing protein [Puia sp.]